MTKSLKNLIGQVLKTNGSLYFAVLTGCLRISRESIFTGLNNLNVYTIKNVQYNAGFGFTDAEVREMCHCTFIYHCVELVLDVRIQNLCQVFRADCSISFSSMKNTGGVRPVSVGRLPVNPKGSGFGIQIIPEPVNVLILGSHSPSGSV